MKFPRTPHTCGGTHCSRSKYSVPAAKRWQRDGRVLNVCALMAESHSAASGHPLIIPQCSLWPSTHSMDGRVLNGVECMCTDGATLAIQLCWLRAGLMRFVAGGGASTAAQHQKHLQKFGLQMALPNGSINTNSGQRQPAARSQGLACTMDMDGLSVA